MFYPIGPGGAAGQPPSRFSGEKAKQLADLRSQLSDAIERGWQFTATMLRRDINDLLNGEG